MRKALALLLCFLLLPVGSLAEFIFAQPEKTPPPADVQQDIAAEPAAASNREILITAAGDVTLGGNMRENPSANMYTRALEAADGNYAHFLSNVYPFFSQDDLTIVNFEGTLTNATKHNGNTYCFRAPPDHAMVLTLSSVEAVAFENNHTMDYQTQGYDDTLDTLRSYGIVYSTEKQIGVYETKGVTIAMLAYQTFNNAYARIHEQMPKDVAAAREKYDIVIVSYHWGEEGDFKPHDRQIKLGRATIDAGADLVLGHHSHRINPIELYNDRYIVYSLGNCSFSGHTNPANMDTFLFQQKFILEDDGTASPGDFRIIPCSISSISAASGAVTASNDMVPTPFAPGSEAAQRVVDRMLKEGKSLDYAVTEYPTEWP